MWEDLRGCVFMRKNKKNIREEFINKRLIEASNLKGEELLKKMNNTLKGYEVEEVKKRLYKYGRNEITSEKKESTLRIFINSFINPFTLVLLVIAIVSSFTDIFLREPKDRSYSTLIIILTMVTISGILNFVQENKSNKASEKLKEMIKIKALVERGGKKDIELSNIVPGDIVYLYSGCMVPADLRILYSNKLFISEATLTGESEPIEKFSCNNSLDSNNPLECTNIAFMGSNVVSGNAVCMAISTGDYTYFGSMAKGISKNKGKTSFEKGIYELSFLLIKFMLFMVPIVFFANGFTKGDWGEAFLFALSVAVGLTPEMLPMIVTTNLAKGALEMAKKKTVVKSLSSMQNFGAMDILCTDKTGTLTEDRVTLRSYVNIYGEKEEEVFKYAFLNTLFQSEEKSVMDLAIISKAKDLNKDFSREGYSKISDFSFDLNRKIISVLLEDEKNKVTLISKGNIEDIMKISSKAEYKGEIKLIDEYLRDKIYRTVKELNKAGFRVLALCKKEEASLRKKEGLKGKRDMILVGYVAFLDPPKESAVLAVEALHKNGVNVKVLTGDNEFVTKAICKEVGIKCENILLGKDISSMEDEKLREVSCKTDIFAKLSPKQKAKIVKVLREKNHVVGFMGDGINDAIAMREADVGISVDTALDIAKEAADIILLERDLMVLESGVIEGRKTFGNIIKYIKMTTSSNFGNMFSVVVASIFLPFLPMLPLQILTLNLIYDISCISIPWDNMDLEYLSKPRRWEASSIGRFMVFIGPISSIFDIATYIILFFIICPGALGGNYGGEGVNKALFASLFNTGWFVESLWSQTLVIYMLRTEKLPFIESRASSLVVALTSLSILFGTLIPYTPLGSFLGMSSLPKSYFPWLFLILFSYMIFITIVKKIFKKRYGELL